MSTNTGTTGMTGNTGATGAGNQDALDKVHPPIAT